MPDLSFIARSLQPFMQSGGIETMDGAEPSAPLDDLGDSIGGSVEQLSELFSPQEEINSKFAQRNANIAKNIRSFSGISDSLSDIALKSGNPIAMGVGAAFKIGDSLTRGSTDEFGVIKDKGKAIVGSILNPVSGISNLVSQGQRKTAKERFVNTEISSKRAEAQVAGNKITNSIPKYTPPSYGRVGRKLTKFTVK